MPELTCFMCGYAWKSKHKEHNPKVCPSCGNPNWKKPSMAIRFLAAWRAFQNPFLVKMTTRRARTIYDTDPLATEATITTESSNSAIAKDSDGLPYTERLI